MLYAVGAQIPEYRVRAFNNASDSTNLIHADEHARRYGYRGGLVPGVSIFAYMSRSLVDFLGRAWLERGSADVRFLHPIYDGEEVRVSGSLAAVGKDGTLRIEFQALNALGVTCARGAAGLPLEAPRPKPGTSDYPTGRSGTSGPSRSRPSRSASCSNRSRSASTGRHTGSTARRRSGITTRSTAIWRIPGGSSRGPAASWPRTTICPPGCTSAAWSSTTARWRTRGRSRPEVESSTASSARGTTSSSSTSPSSATPAASRR